MRYYEMLFIVHPNYEQDRLDTVISAVQKEITALGGTILKTDNWGKRKLAYLINKQRYGSYVLMYFEADPSIVQGVYEWMEIQSQVLHQMIIRLEEKPELTDESQNPDSPTRSYVKPSAPVKESAPAQAKADVPEVAETPDEDVTEENKESDSADATADTTEEKAVEVDAEEEAAKPASAEATADKPADVPEAEEEAAVEEAEETVKESASAEATADKEGE